MRHWRPEFLILPVVLVAGMALAAEKNLPAVKNSGPGELPRELRQPVVQQKEKTPAQLASEASVEALVWPPPPLPERVRYSHEFRLASDLGIRPSFFSRIFNWFVGKKTWSMVRPYAIAADNELVVVADPGAKSVFLFNLKQKEHLRIDKAGKQRLNSPVGVALGENHLFIADSRAAKVHIFSRTGDFRKSITTLKRPTGLAWHAGSQRLYVVDTLAHNIVVFNEHGDHQFEFGRRTKSSAGFNYPSHLAIHNDRVYVNDTMNFRIQIFDLDGRFISKFGEHGDRSGLFSQPKGIGVDAAGHIYVADSIFHKVQIFNDKGRFLLDIGQQGRRPGEFWLPAGVFVNKNRIYVADSYNRRVQVFDYTFKGADKGTGE